MAPDGEWSKEGCGAGQVSWSVHQQHLTHSDVVDGRRGQVLCRGKKKCLSC